MVPVLATQSGTLGFFFDLMEEPPRIHCRSDQASDIRNHPMSGLLDECRGLTRNIRADLGVFAANKFFRRSLVNRGLQPGFQKRLNLFQHEVAFRVSGVVHSTNVILRITNCKWPSNQGAFAPINGEWADQEVRISFMAMHLWRTATA